MRILAPDFGIAEVANLLVDDPGGMLHKIAQGQINWLMKYRIDSIYPTYVKIPSFGKDCEH
jgi:hypothetical protein